MKMQGVGAIWEELLTKSKLLCSTYLKIKGVCSLKAINLKYTGENTASGIVIISFTRLVEPEEALGRIPLGVGIIVKDKPSDLHVLRNVMSLCVLCTLL